MVYSIYTSTVRILYGLWSRWHIHKNLGHRMSEIRRISGLGSRVARGPQGETSENMEISAGESENSWGFLGKSMKIHENVAGICWDLKFMQDWWKFPSSGWFIHVYTNYFYLFLPENWGWLVLALTTLAHWAPKVIWFWDLDRKQLPILVLNHHQGKWANHGCTILHEKHRGLWVIWSCLIFQNGKSVSCTWKLTTTS